MAFRPQCLRLRILVEWNKQLAPEVTPSTQRTRTKTIRRITAERPADGIWAHLNQLASIKLSEKLVRRRALEEAIALTDEQIESKAAGLAFTIRNATDYFRGTPNESMNKRILSLYYGSLALAFAEMLASPNGPADLDEVEGMTKQGHGLFTVPSITNDFGGLNVGVLATGFFPNWATFLGHHTSNYPKSKPKSPSDLEKLPQTSVTTIGGLLSALPELGGLFREVYELEPSWITPIYDMDSNHSRSNQEVDSSYILFIDRSGRFTSDRLRQTQWPITEVTSVENNDGGGGIFYRGRVDHSGYKYWHQVLPLHNSSFVESGSLIFPVLGGVFEYRALSLTILYALSILVRYMPSAWRRVEGGDWDQHLALVKMTLDVLERQIPQEFLESITGEKVYSKLPGSFH